MPLDLTSEYVIGPQPGAQELFLASSADIALYGGAAGGGKTYAILLEPLRHIDNPDFGAVIFRRDAVQITSEGGLFDTSFRLYPRIGGVPRLSPHRMWTFRNGASITFNHLHNEKDVNDWQGAQIPLICYDELTHFTANQFWYMLSRNRSTCGIRPYIRATCNPDADSWVAELVAWYIDDNGFPLYERSGILRYMVRIDDTTYWYASRQEALFEHPSITPKSFTFIAATLEDNKILVKTDPGYKANLQAMNRVERERLLHGNWKIRPQAGSYFPSIDVEIISAVPADVAHWVRRWDLAATEPSEVNPSPNSTASVLMGRRANGKFVIADASNIKKGAHVVRELIKQTATLDKSIYGRVTTVVPQDPGQAGKDQSQSLVVMLAGYKAKTVRETGKKETRAEPLSAQWQVGNVQLVTGAWNKPYLNEMEAFPATGMHDDYVDASSGAFLECIAGADQEARWRALAE